MNTTENLMESFIRHITRKILASMSPIQVDLSDAFLSSNVNDPRLMRKLPNFPHACTCCFCPYNLQREFTQFCRNAYLGTNILYNTEFAPVLNYRYNYSPCSNTYTNMMGSGKDKVMQERILTDNPEMSTTSSVANNGCEMKFQNVKFESLVDCKSEANNNKDTDIMSLKCCSNLDGCNRTIGKGNNKIGKIAVRNLKELTETYNSSNNINTAEYPQPMFQSAETQTAPTTSTSIISVQTNPQMQRHVMNNIGIQTQYSHNVLEDIQASASFSPPINNPCKRKLQTNMEIQDDPNNKNYNKKIKVQSNTGISQSSKIENVGKIFLNKQREMTEVYNLPDDHIVGEYDIHQLNQTAPITGAVKKKKKKKKKSKKSKVGALEIALQIKKNKKEKKKKKIQMTEPQFSQAEYVTELLTKDFNGIVDEIGVENCIDDYNYCFTIL